MRETFLATDWIGQLIGYGFKRESKVEGQGRLTRRRAVLQQIGMAGGVVTCGMGRTEWMKLFWIHSTLKHKTGQLSKDYRLELSNYWGGEWAKASVAPGEKKHHHRKPWRDIPRPLGNMANHWVHRVTDSWCLLVFSHLYYFSANWPKIQLLALALSSLWDPLCCPHPRPEVPGM